MTRREILSEIKKYFTIDELVCNHVLERWGEEAWNFLDTHFLQCLLVLRRDVVGMPMYCNNHAKGIYQRGLRCNQCELVKSKDRPYLSAHVLGKAGDFSISEIRGVTKLNSFRTKIKMLPNIWPCSIRLEEDVTWLHFDVLPNSEGLKVKFFKG